MDYYKAIGHEKATLIPRYFMSDDVADKKEALGQIRKAMGSLVLFSEFLLCPFILTSAMLIGSDC
jgi:hypothetical protein